MNGYDFPAHIQKQAEENKADIKDLKERVNSLEKDGAVQAERMVTVQTSLTKIDSNTTWIVRLILGAIAAYILTFIVKGGLNV
ncbi:MAG: hemolysin XhlA family protein [Rhizobium sp.]|nr:hemolysin XhlA family protein [Rhizobium sp.]